MGSIPPPDPAGVVYKPAALKNYSNSLRIRFVKWTASADKGLGLPVRGQARFAGGMKIAGGYILPMIHK